MPALFDLIPALKSQLPWCELGVFPTPLEQANGSLGAGAGPLWLKRDDVSASAYGGNKVRLLEPVFGLAKAQGASRVFSAGAVGSNHAVATALHAPRVGLAAGALLFPRSPTPDAIENLRLLAGRALVRQVVHFTLLPWVSARLREQPEPDGSLPFVVSQTDSNSPALFGYVSAALELALQVRAGLAPAPRQIVLPVGSAATSAGLLLGLVLAERLGLAFAVPPRVLAVRVVAGPISTRRRVLALGRRASERLALLAGDSRLRVEGTELARLLVVTASELGRGYPYPTAAGAAARERFRAAGHPLLDDTYSAKAAAALLAELERGAAGPMLFWCTKSSVPLPPVHEEALRELPPRLRHFASIRA